MLHKKILLILFVTNLALALSAQNRSIDGRNNNPLHPTWGAAMTNQLQVIPFDYADGMSEPGGQDRPNPRTISNAIFAQEEVIPDGLGLSAYTWVWGQFIDHDVTLSPEDHSQPLFINVPKGDPHFDAAGTGNAIIPFVRSVYDPSTGGSVSNPRQFPNAITSFIDASNVYGSDRAKARWLRSFEGGKLKTSTGNLLPYNTITGELEDAIDHNAPEMAMANPYAKKWFVAGDVRANENVLLTSIHTIFMREHNRLCDELIVENPSWDDETIYQRARKIVGAEVQAIVYEEWLPTMGVQIDKYSFYKHSLNPGIMNVFSTAAYRYGHTVVSSEIPRMNKNGFMIDQGHMTLKKAFFHPEAILSGGGIEPLLIGMATQIEQDFDTKLIDDLRNVLFEAPGQMGLDLAALNIQRGRERGLADYNSIREAFGLTKHTTFSQISDDAEVTNALEEVYGDINNIDAWVGLLAEDYGEETLFGQTVNKIMRVQFTNLRDGDYFYYQNDADFDVILETEIKGTRLADVIKRNTSDNLENIQHNIFLATPIGTTSTAEAEIDEFDIMVYPNPCIDHIFVNINSERNSMAKVEVLDITGKAILVKNIRFKKGRNNFELTLGDNISGAYTIVINNNNKISSKQIVKN